MSIGKKIKQLRFKMGLTQEALAEKLSVSPQAVSKWETGYTLPDINLLPSISEVMGVTIDELFDLSVEQKMNRIENVLDREDELPSEMFVEHCRFLEAEMLGKNRDRAVALLANLYSHRMESDSKRVSKLSRESIMKNPEKKECQWLLCKAEGAEVWDWNFANHAKVIDFYKSVIENDKVEPRTPMPYFYLIDNLIADHRTEEARHYLSEFAKLPAHKPVMVDIYMAHIALAEYDESAADKIMLKAEEKYGDDKIFLFEAAQYYAKKAEYERAIGFYNRSWGGDKKPRFTDAMQGIAIIYEILGEKEKTIEAYSKIIACLKDEWGYTDDDAPVISVMREKSRVLEK